MMGLPVAVGLVAGGVALDLSNPSSGVTNPLLERTGRPAPAFTLPEVLDPARRLSLSDFRGKPLVLNFWASWCYPCRTEMPLLESAERSENGSVQFVGIDTNDTRGAAAAFLARTHVSYVSLFLPKPGRVSSSYELIGLPITVFISAGGRVLGRHIGQFNRATLEAALALAFGKRP